MRKRFVALLIAVLFCIPLVTGVAFASDKAKGVVKSIDMNAGTVVITDKKSGKDVTVIVEDKEKLKSYKTGDNVKVRYEEKGGKNVATDFRGEEGC
jgi:Cu/Ag efflux protein CusF